MPLKQYNPTSPGRRFMTTLTFEEVTKDQAEKGVDEPKRRTGGRDNRGRISVRFIGGGHKKRYRIVDFRRDKKDIPALVAAIEYDPNRSARLALLHYRAADKRYILYPQALKVGPTVAAAAGAHRPPSNPPPPQAIPPAPTSPT